MSLLFGRLTENFVTFGTMLASGNSDPAQLAAAAASFRQAAALNASYLVYIGKELTILYWSRLLIDAQVLECSLRPLLICISGFTPERLTPSASVNVICKLSFVKTSHTLTTSVPEK